MSTFNGQMPEFPDIRVDFFRYAAGLRPPRACFLSHVHSDHLAGLETLKSPFVYCSAPTRELLLRLERYPHRINFQMGVLESRKQHFKHLKALLKPIPLETPTTIELEPGNEIQVTLFNANHCTGAVMFLFEGNGKAVLYTGDIRAEPWFVNSLSRNPFLIEYSAQLKYLDCIYLDTSFTEDLSFPTKDEGLRELLQKVAQYPSNTKFHFTAWTFGYEEVWMALSKALKSRIHVDSYKLRLYQALRGEMNGTKNHAGPFLCQEGPVLAGYKCGNSQQFGCLTLDENVRLHSCEKGTSCSGVDENTVWIRPIITRTSSGVEIGEVGVGGGSGDLRQCPEIELSNDVVVQQLMQTFAKVDSSLLRTIRTMLLDGLNSHRKALSLEDMGLDREEDEMTLEDLAKVLVKSIEQKLGKSEISNGTDHCGGDENSDHISGLPRTISFPYSRHSSFAELCHLVEAFRPKDVYPCTVDERNWHLGVSVRSLFGDLCSENTFRHDQEMTDLFGHLEEDNDSLSQTTSSNGHTSVDESLDQPITPPGRRILFSDTMDESMHKRPRLDSALTHILRRSSPTVLQEDDDAGGIQLPDISYFDKEDNVYRCTICDWELWSPTGPCSGCKSGFPSYGELVPPKVKPEGVENPEPDRKRKRENCEILGWVDDLDLEELRTNGLIGDYLDVGSGYSSESNEDVNEYEVDSFIDDESVDDGDESDESDEVSQGAEGCTKKFDYKLRYHFLLVDHHDLLDKHEKVSRKHREFKQDILGTDYETSDSEQYIANRPMTSDHGNLIASSLVDLQDTSVSDGMAPEDDGDLVESVDYPQNTGETEDDKTDVSSVFEGEHGISLLSTNDNHSRMEVEL